MEDNPCSSPGSYKMSHAGTIPRRPRYRAGFGDRPIVFSRSLRRIWWNLGQTNFSFQGLCHRSLACGQGVSNPGTWPDVDTNVDAARVDACATGFEGFQVAPKKISV